MLKTCQKSLVLPMKNVTVCTFTASPCVPAQRAHMFQHVCAWCRYKRGRFERTHGGVLSGHTGFFQCATTHHTPPHNTEQHTTHETETDRQRQTETDRDRGRRQRKKTGTERESKTEEERQDKRREDKRRQDKTTEERRFIFSVVVHGRS